MLFLLSPYGLSAQNSPLLEISDSKLANGIVFPNWEKKQVFLHTYYVDGNNPSASDGNQGTADHPFKTISKAAEIMEPGDRVIIREGEYRETVHPARGGESAEKMITYEAAAGAKVIISGSFLLDIKRWKEGRGWIYANHEPYTEDSIITSTRIWQYDFNGNEFGGYNPFGMVNLMHDREYLQYKKVNMDRHFLRRGILFLNGKPLEQVMNPVDLASKDSGAFWIEHNGLRIHVRFPGNSRPDDYRIEATAKEQVFVPLEYGLGYVAIKGITFQHAGNGFPVPQRGLVSTNRGHHWLIEKCTIEWANSLGLDMGNEMWSTVHQPGLGYHIVRNNLIKNCGIGGLEALGAKQMLIEDNLFENIGWQNAELAFESGAIKIHTTINTMIRRNVFRHISYAPGIWLDYLANENCRITKNVFADIITARGAIYIEVSRHDCLVDHNIFYKLRSQYWLSGEYGAGGSALYTDGSDSIRFSDNLMLDIENTGYGDYLNADRIVGSRGGVTRWHSVTNNIFIDCRKHAIEFPNMYNFSNGNIFSHVPPGYLKMGNPLPALLLDIEERKKCFGWEKDGKKAEVGGKLNPNSLELSITGKTIELEKLFLKGPFKDYQKFLNINIDPRLGY